MRRYKKGMINSQCKISSKEGHMIIFKISQDPEADPDPILFSGPDPLKQIISYPGGLDPAPQHCFSVLSKVCQLGEYMDIFLWCSRLVRVLVSCLSSSAIDLSLFYIIRVFFNSLEIWQSLHAFHVIRLPVLFFHHFQPKL